MDLRLAVKGLICLFILLITTEQSIGCPTGTFGPSCAYVDLVFNSPEIIVTKSDNMRWSIHGHRCQYLNGPALIEIQIEPPVAVFWIRAKMQREAALQDFEVTFKTTSKQIVGCLEQKMVVYRPKLEVDVQCKKGKDLIDRVSVFGEFSATCHVHVSGGRDLLKPENAKFETQVEFIRYHDIHNCLDLDNRTTCRTFSQRVTRSNWLQIDLPRPAFLLSYQLYPGHDERLLANNQVNISAANMSVLWFFSSEELPLRLNQGVPLNSAMQLFHFAVFNNNGRLELAEIRLLGTFACESGHFGITCEDSCFCENKAEQCFLETGGCPGGCSVGFQGLNCSIPCDDGFFGPNCTQFCPSDCSGVCDKITGECNSCAVGFYGSSCQTHCSDGCEADGCEKDTGKCNRCRIGFYGNTCDQQCGKGCVGQRCGRETGNCNCTRHFLGAKCDEKKCCSGCAVQCNQADGQCDHCKHGYFGSDCCKECLPGSFGIDCNQTCPENCLHYACDWRTGNCRDSLCKPGYQGLKCQQACAEGTWGFNCSRNCSQYCNGTCQFDDGSCQACLIGYGLPRCDTCGHNKYGNGCRHNCHYCLHQPCDKINGRCPGNLCQAGWRGELCDLPCASKTWGPECNSSCSPHCANYGSCNKTNGYCIDGCTKKFLPPLCVEVDSERKNISPCPTSTWGEHCERKCSIHCGGDANCRKDNGACLQGCRNSYIPPSCQIQKRFSSFVGIHHSNRMDFLNSSLFSGLGIAAFLVVTTSGILGYFYYQKKQNALIDPRQNPEGQANPL